MSAHGDYRQGRKEPRDAVSASGAAANDRRAVADHASLSVPLIARLYREAMKDKGYQEYELGRDVAAYLRAKRKVLTKDSYRDYESVLDKLVRYFCDLSLSDFEPPVGTDRLEEFLEHQWGSRAPRTYNKALSIISDFFKHHRLRDHLQGDPCLAIERARKRDVYRTTYTPSQTRAIIASTDDLRDRVCLRLLLTYGLRKGAVLKIQYLHFDHARKRLTVFTKGGKVRELPIPDRHLWLDLERHILDVQAQAHHYLLCTQKTIPRAGVRRFPERPMTSHGMHRWWYRCLADAGIVAEGTSRGERMHKARHTAGQRVLDHTGNLKAVQQLLMHASIQTTGDSYVDWDIDQLAATMEIVLEAEAKEVDQDDD
jgi:integrase